MSNALTFSFENTQLSVLGDFLNPLFIAKQVCDLLGFGNSRQALETHCDPEDVTKVEMLDRLNRKQLVNCVNESGLYALIFGSKLPKAKQFKRWVTNEVLPAIRKQGYYQVTSNTLTPAQQHQIQTAVAARAQKTAHNYQTIYRALKNRYQVARYDQIPQSQFQDALKFIQCINLNVPETPITTAPPETYVVDEDFLKTLQVFCYYQRYLFRKPLMQAMRVMLALDVPDASKLWDSANDFNFIKLERLLDDLGFSVKDLDCYKHWALTHTV
ncbi:BRO family protein [uncultured Parasutterella sp.]|uniref:BRO family protein n=1 Tax=uncultured Parasutterella sp. TaxID=1263098 RepID=UPI0025B6B5F5|nr:BRO family protein [uncultured Parasutterella sp.]